MILKRVRVENFRAIRDETVEFGRHTAILGGNGAGKSTILRAIDRFYAPQTTVEADDFFGRRLDAAIEISLTFTGFNPDETERFGDRIIDGEMTVTRVFDAAGGRANGRYFGSTWQYQPFAEIRQLNGAVEKRQRFNELHEALGLSRASNLGDVEAQMVAWEAANRHQCNLVRDDGQFFGFQNVGRGSLQKSTSFVFIPAVRDASNDSVDARGAVIARLMELVVRNAVQRRPDFREFQGRTSDEYRELVSPERLPELNGLSDGLTATLKDFYADAAVNLQWRTPNDFEVPLPAADVSLAEDGFDGPVDRKGHGLQRAFIVTLLQHLARAGSAELNALPADGDEPQEEPAPYVLPGLILAIEEPELYQHPTKQRHFANVLRRLSDGSLPGVAAQTQVIFASHSALFVSIDRFDEVRLARRFTPENGGDRECRITTTTFGAVIERLAHAHQINPDAFTLDGLRSRLHVIGPELAEGFFADVAVLVEGVSDRAALLGAAKVMGIDLEAMGIAVLNAEGKTKIDKPAAIFTELGIPTYVVFDCDAARNGEGPNNRALQRMLGEQAPFDCETRVTATYASFHEKAEQVLSAELTAEVFDAQVQAAQARFGIKKKEALKTPAAMSAILSAAADQGRRSATMEAIIAAIVAKRGA